MLELITNRGDLKNELYELVRFFDPCGNIDGEVNFTSVSRGTVDFYVSVCGKEYFYSYPQVKAQDKLDYVRQDNKMNKTALYSALSDYFGKTLPWGSLTGIRPTRVVSRLMSTGLPLGKAITVLKDEYFVSTPKAQLAAACLRTQKSVTDRLSVASNGVPENAVNLYVHIPFCPTRCSYCSFVSAAVEKQKWLLSPYVDALVTEIEMTKRLLAEHGKTIFSVYVGGGTPTVLDPLLLYKVLSSAYVEGVEFTCEAGRPDTITEEKLAVLAACGVNRISINPQTLHDETLVKIGRAHTVEQFYQAYALAEKFGFVKNVDLIAGLEDETAEDFRASLCGVAKLKPENVTVHTLCVKRGSRNADTFDGFNAGVQEMVDDSVRILPEEGYAPYYLYRQKQAAGNLENVGWCRGGFLCVNNVTVMEEMLSVFACGAGAIGKSLCANGRIERFANPKDVMLYLNEFTERMNKKQNFYRNQFTIND
ncbi:MAG: coproporphyrinogen dehydrogenase HemZ [Clostridiales bacterium]|nr:coproporphyrinogen dehydrogenase HemZ [Clostridiales bacterium]